MPGALRARLTARLNAWTVAAIAVVVAGFLPFSTSVALGGCFYFRDLSSYFVPLRHFVVDGLRAGEIRHWNPYVNEGTPVFLPPVAYPIDLLQALVPGPWGLSLLLALHVPLAALTFLGLARRLGWRPAAAALGALVYALSGFSLSCLNLYIHIEALAWAPLVIWMLLRASAGAPRDVALAGASLALCVSSSGVEIAAQAVACAFVLGACRRIASHLRFASGVLLGAGLAASPLLLLASSVSGGRRGAGFTVAESLSGSVHPVALLQVVIAGLFGDPIAAGSHYWGAGYWRGHPYILSLYLGGAVLCLVAIGAATAGRHRNRLLLLLGLGLLVSLGSWARLDVVLELVPALTRFRFPVKAFFTVTTASALLATSAADTLLSSRRAWSALTAAAVLVGAALLSLSAVEPLLPGAFAWLQVHFFGGPLAEGLRAGALRAIAADAAAGALALLAIAGLGALTLRGRIGPGPAVVATAAIVAADLLRAGAGLNPTAPAALYGLSPEMQAVAARLRREGGRTFTCANQAMPAYREAARRMGSRAGLWSVALYRESLSPYTNMDVAVPATGSDPTAFTSTARTLSSRESMCGEAGTLRRLRESAVRSVVTVEPFRNEALQPMEVVSPARVAPLSIYIYRLKGSLGDPSVWSSAADADQDGEALEGAVARYVDEGAETVRVAVTTPRDADLVLRRTAAPGWTATVNGKPAALSSAGGHQAVRVPSGASEVVLRYRPPNARLGAILSLSAAFLALAPWLAPRPPATAAAARPSGLASRPA